MRQRRQISQTQIAIEQIALLFTSFVWTTVILSAIIFVWAIQDAESNWNAILGIPVTPVFAQEPPLALIPTHTPWPTLPPPPTPTETLIPSATPTLVIKPPDILPDTPNEDDPTPVPIVEDVAEPEPTATATPTPVANQPTSVAPVQPTPIPASPDQNIPPSRLLIPAVGIDAPIISVGWDLVEQNGKQYSVWQVADDAVGWHKTTALPGDPGNTVMAGHHNVKGEVFRDLVNVEVGDEIVIYTGDISYTYKVELKTIVKEKGESLDVRRKNAEWIAPTTDERITMVTCWPYTNNTHRVIVVAKPVF